MKTALQLLHQLSEFPSKTGVPLWISLAAYALLLIIALLPHTRTKKPMNHILKLSADQVAILYAINESCLEQYQFLGQTTAEEIEKRRPYAKQIEQSTYNEIEINEVLELPSEVIQEGAQDYANWTADILTMLEGLPHQQEYEFNLCPNCHRVLVENLMGFLRTSLVIGRLSNEQIHERFPIDGPEDLLGPFRALFGESPKEWFMEQNVMATELLQSFFHQ